MKPHPQVGDVWHRVDGDWIDDGSEAYVGMELTWTTWEVIKVTKCGAWFKCVEWPYKKQRFAGATRARWLTRTKQEALQGLIARKRRHLSIMDQHKRMATETMALAKAALAKLQAPPAEPDLDRIEEQMSDEDHLRLVELRGGCSCHISPPCHNHSEPLMLQEAEELGLIDNTTEAS